MKTTIVIKSPDTRVAVSTPATAEQPSYGDAVDAGAAPGATVPSSSGPPSTSSDRYDGGEPPAWLLDAVAAAGGSVAPSEGPRAGNGVEVFDAGPGPSVS